MKRTPILNKLSNWLIVSTMMMLIASLFVVTTINFLFFPDCGRGAGQECFAVSFEGNGHV